MTTESRERPHLLTLPPEIALSIWRYHDKKTLKALRITSKICQRYSTQPLFQSFTLYPHLRSFQRLIHLSKQPTIAEHVEEIHYDTILLGLTDMIVRRLDSVYSAQINEVERKEVIGHARRLHNQDLRPDAAFDELAQLSYLGMILPALPNLKSFSVTDAAGLQIPSYGLVQQLPPFYQQLVDETCGRFEHTRLERGMFGTPRCNGGSYARPVIMSLHKFRKPIERLVLRGIRGPALLSNNDFLKNTLLFDNVFQSIKHFELMQSGDSQFPGIISMISLQRMISHMVSLERLELLFRDTQEPDVRGNGKDLLDLTNDVRCRSFFANSSATPNDRVLSPRLSWSPVLQHLVVTGMVCSLREMKSVLRYCAASLKRLEIGNIVLVPDDESTGDRSCCVGLIKWMQSQLRLESIKMFGIWTNGGMQDWLVHPERTGEGVDLLLARVNQYILTGGECPLDHVAIPPGYFDLGKKTYSAEVPEDLDTEAFEGDATWVMTYTDEVDEWHEGSDWTGDDDHDIMFDLDPDLDETTDSDEDVLGHLSNLIPPFT